MKCFTAKFAILSVFAVLSVSAFAESDNVTTVNVTWEDPGSYTDIRASNESRKKFQKRIFKEFEAYFAKLAETLPSEQTLDITVTNVDLAGHVWPSFGYGNDLRIIESVYIPRLKFSYELKQGGQVIKSADVDLKELAFMERGSMLRDSDTLRYEKSMLKRWFKDEFAESVAVN